MLAFEAESRTAHPETLIRERADASGNALCPRCGKPPPPGWAETGFDMGGLVEQDFCVGGTRCVSAAQWPADICVCAQLVWHCDRAA